MSKPTLYLGDIEGLDGNVFVILAKAAKVTNETMRKYFNAVVMESVSVETKPL